MRYFSNLTRVQNMGWEFKYFAILEIWQNCLKITQNITTLLFQTCKKYFFETKNQIPFGEL